MIIWNYSIDHDWHGLMQQDLELCILELSAGSDDLIVALDCVMRRSQTSCKTDNRLSSLSDIDTNILNSPLRKFLGEYSKSGHFYLGSNKRILYKVYYVNFRHLKQSIRVTDQTHIPSKTPNGEWIIRRFKNEAGG